MKAAVVESMGERPIYGEFDEPAVIEGHCLINVSASALSHVTRARASGAHYSSAQSYPFVAGVDGTGRLENGQRVYFFKPRAPFGAMAERTLVPQAQCIALPDSLEDVTAAALAIPGMSSWAALVERAGFVAGETVLINGATGTSGRLAVQIAKHLGAAHIIVTGRNAAALESLTLAGADITISLEQSKDKLIEAFEAQFHRGVDVVLDYLWGTSAESLLFAAARAAADDYHVRFVQIGAISGPDIKLPAAILRSKAITLLGSGIGSIPLMRLFDTMKKVFDAAVPAGLQVATQAFPLAELSAHWENADSLYRTVFIP
ncbi:NADPH:quinone reductase [Paraburkholderia fungorum]|uniref:NADPH:quinone reductase n=1 Tax=Paraburkholderia fungorum TaxID=134537 RepID=A0A1H1ICN0_9BURK|nr:zinc-binding alcohol dehydrogenase family protein [Paraburkholderia fungorum]SDR35126.1 NADPH:quinone reductase [Paraburkholderia fungorum]